MFGIFNKKKIDDIAKKIENSNEQDYWSIVKRQFRKNRLAVWSLRFFYVILFIAIFADFIANEKPLYCSIKGESSRDTISDNTKVSVSTDTLVFAITEAMPNNDENSRDSAPRSTKQADGSHHIEVVRTTTRKSYTLIPPAPTDSTQRIVRTDSTLTRTVVAKVDSSVQSYFPILRQYLVDLGWATWEPRFTEKKWYEHKYESAIFPLITYLPTTFDKKNEPYTSPFAEQKLGDNNGRHYLGTDDLKRDVAAGMVHGTRTAMMVGIVSMSISLLIGIFFGALAGYFGDDRLKVSRIRILLNILAFILFVFYAFIVRGYAMADNIGKGYLIRETFMFFGLLGGIFAIANLLAVPLKRVPFLGKKVKVGVDLLIMRLIEIVNSIPVLILILAVVAIIKTPSIVYVMGIIGIVSWTGIAKFLRAELLRVRRLEYIEAAQAFGYSEWRIILRHAIPNSLAPVLISLAFGVASAILTESFLSFIGVGVPAEQVTWGSLLSLSRNKFDAWWLAVFPGIAIFVTVTIFNLLGEGLTDALDPRMK